MRILKNLLRPSVSDKETSGKTLHYFTRLGRIFAQIRALLLVAFKAAANNLTKQRHVLQFGEQLLNWSKQTEMMSGTPLNLRNRFQCFYDYCE